MLSDIFAIWICIFTLTIITNDTIIKSDNGCAETTAHGADFSKEGSKNGSV